MKKWLLVCSLMLTFVGEGLAQVSVTRVERGVPVRFNAEVSQGINFVWRFPDEVLRGPSVLYTFNDSGIFDVTLSASDNFGRTNQITKKVRVDNTPPTGDITVSPASGDLQTYFVFQANGADEDQDVLSYTWSFPNGETLDGAIVSHQFSDLGNQVVRLEIDDGQDVSELETEVEVLESLAAVNRPPTLEVRGVLPHSMGTVDQVFSFYIEALDPDLDALTYRWEMGDGSRMFVANPAYKYRSTGSYTATVTVSDGEHEVSGSLLVQVVEEDQNIGIVDPETQDLAAEVSLLPPGQLEAPDIVSGGGGIPSEQKIGDMIDQSTKVDLSLQDLKDQQAELEFLLLQTNDPVEKIRIQNELAEIKAQIEVKSSQSDVYDVETAQILTSNIKNLTADLQDLSRQKAALVQDLAAAKDPEERARIQAQINQIDAAIKEVESALDLNYRSVNPALVEQVQSGMRLELAAMEAEKKDLQSRLDKAVDPAVRDQLESQIQELESSLAARNKALDQGSQVVATASTELVSIDEVVQQVQDLEAVRTNLKRALAQTSDPDQRAQIQAQIDSVESQLEDRKQMLRGGYERLVPQGSGDFIDTNIAGLKANKEILEILWASETDPQKKAVLKAQIQSMEAEIERQSQIFASGAGGGEVLEKKAAQDLVVSNIASLESNKAVLQSLLESETDPEIRRSIEAQIDLVESEIQRQKDILTDLSEAEGPIDSKLLKQSSLAVLEANKSVLEVVLEQESDPVKKALIQAQIDQLESNIGTQQQILSGGLQGTDLLINQNIADLEALVEKRGSLQTLLSTTTDPSVRAQLQSEIAVLDAEIETATQTLIDNYSAVSPEGFAIFIDSEVSTLEDLALEKQALELALARETDPEVRSRLKSEIEALEADIQAALAASVSSYATKRFEYQSLRSDLLERIENSNDPVEKAILRAQLQEVEFQLSSLEVSCQQVDYLDSSNGLALIEDRLIWNYSLFLHSMLEADQNIFEDALLNQDLASVEAYRGGIQVVETLLSNIDQLQAERRHLLFKSTKGAKESLEDERRTAESRLVSASDKETLFLQEELVRLDQSIQALEQWEAAGFEGDPNLLNRFTTQALATLQADQDRLVQKIVTTEGTEKVIAQASLADVRARLVDQSRLAEIERLLAEESTKTENQEEELLEASDLLRAYDASLDTYLAADPLGAWVEQGLADVKDLQCVLSPKVDESMPLAEARDLIEKAQASLLSFKPSFVASFSAIQDRMTDHEADLKALSNFIGSDFSGTMRVEEVLLFLESEIVQKNEVLTTVKEESEADFIADEITSLKARKTLVASLKNVYNISNEVVLSEVEPRLKAAGASDDDLRIWKQIYDVSKAAQTLASKKEQIKGQKARLVSGIDQFSEAQKKVAAQLQLKLDQDLAALDQIGFDIANRSQFDLVLDFQDSRNQLLAQIQATTDPLKKQALEEQLAQLDTQIGSMIQNASFYQSLLSDMVGTTQTQFFLYGDIETTSKRALFFEWDLGNGETIVGQNPRFTYPTPGFYRATLEVSDGLTSQENSLTIKIEAPQ